MYQSASLLAQQLFGLLKEDLRNQPDDDFLPKLLELEGTTEPLAPYHAHGYDAFNILMDAIVAAHVGDDADGTSYFSRDGIREYIDGLTDYAGLTGTLSCVEGDCGSEEVSIAQLVDGVFTEVYTTRAQ